MGTGKKRPALVILDIGDADIILAHITTKERSGQGDYKLRDWSSSGLLRESWVRLAKITCLDKSDITCRVGQLIDHDKDMIITLWQRVYVF
jgi:mRNA interferase MazF